VDRFEVRKNDAPEETGSGNKSGSSMWWRKAEVDDLYRWPEHATRLYQQKHTQYSITSTVCITAGQIDAECAEVHMNHRGTDCVNRHK